MNTKQLIGSIAVIGFGSLAGFAQETTRTETTVRENPDGSVTETTRTVTFTPEQRTKVISYFKPYQDERYGLPQEIATKIKIEKLPSAWRSSSIEPGVVIEKEHRPLLVKAPPKLVSVIPASESAKLSYYVAGGNVVAVDPQYRVVESVRIPTVVFETE